MRCRRRLIGLAEGMAALALVAGVTGGTSVAGDRKTPRYPGAAVVVNVALAPQARLPTTDALTADPGGVARGYAETGFEVARDPCGRCLAVTAGAEITGEQIEAGELPDTILAAAILREATSKQLDARKLGYVPWLALSQAQVAAARRLLQRRGLMDELGLPSRPGELVVGMWTRWRLYIWPGRRVARRAYPASFTIEPPTPVVVDEPALAGSVLWWLWPHADAEWGTQPVSVEAGTFSLGELLARLSAGTGVQISAEAEYAEQEVSVVASDVPLRHLLWAMEIATGRQLRGVPPEAPQTFLFAGQRTRLPASQGPDPFLQLPGLGCPSPWDSEGGAELLSQWRGRNGPQIGNWVGWRLAELPAVYRWMIDGIWSRGAKFRDDMADPEAPLSPQDAVVIWLRCVLVHPALRSEWAGWAGPELLIPVVHAWRE